MCTLPHCAQQPVHRYQMVTLSHPSPLSSVSAWVGARSSQSLKLAYSRASVRLSCFHALYTLRMPPSWVHPGASGVWWCLRRREERKSFLQARNTIRKVVEMHAITSETASGQTSLLRINFQRNCTVTVPHKYHEVLYTVQYSQMYQIQIACAVLKFVQLPMLYREKWLWFCNSGHRIKVSLLQGIGSNTPRPSFPPVSWHSQNSKSFLSPCGRYGLCLY